jgi:uncharacterized protein YciI
MLSEGPDQREESIIHSHFEYLQSLTGGGDVLLAGRTTNTDVSSFGIVILATDDENKAISIMKSDPAVEQRVMHAQLFPFRIALSNRAISGISSD